MNFDEAGVIQLLSSIFGSNHRGVDIGIGDDGAVVKTSDRTVITNDVAVEGTHFQTEWSSAFEIGRKITAANLADVYAMGGQPQYLVVALTLTGDESLDWIEELAQGIAHEANSCGAVVVGGDLAKGKNKSISITAVGSVQSPIKRSGAQVGDGIFLSSLPGWSAAGLAILQSSINSGSELIGDNDFATHAVSEFSAPTVDYTEAVAFASAGAHSLIDISDAFVIQAKQMADASKVTFEIDQELITKNIEFESLKELADLLKTDVWQWILAGGEDHVFLATGKNLKGFKVGTVIELIDGQSLTGVEMKKAPDTWRHFQ
jgi:thiamine-monophosphate kinase